MRQISVIILCYSLSLNPLGGCAWAADTDAITIEGENVSGTPQKVVTAEALPPPQDSVKSQAKKTKWRWSVIAVGTVILVVVGGRLAVRLFFDHKSRPGRLQPNLMSTEPVLDQTSQNLEQFTKIYLEDKAQQDSQPNLIHELTIIQNAAKSPVHHIQALQGLKRFSLDGYERMAGSFASINLENIPQELQGMTTNDLEKLKKTLEKVALIKNELNSFIFPAKLVNWRAILGAAAWKMKQPGVILPASHNSSATSMES